MTTKSDPTALEVTEADEAAPERYAPAETTGANSDPDEVTEIEAPELEAPETETVKTKFVVESVTQHRGEAGTAVMLNPVYGNEGENKAFWQATPQGQIDITITNPATAILFKPGQEFHVNFTPVAA